MSYRYLLRFKLLLILLPLALNGNAAEENKFPRSYDVLKSDFQAYFTRSTDTLNRFDGLTRGRVNSGGEQRWKNQCERVLSTLEQAVKRAQSSHSVLNSEDDLPDPVLNWIDAERQAWTNVSQIGTDLIVLHDEIVSQTDRIKTRYLPALESARQAINGMAKALQKGLEKLFEAVTGIPITMPDGTDQPLEEQYEKEVAPVATALQRKLLSTRQEAEGLDQFLRKVNYDGRLRSLQNRNIDPDQQGVFANHEKTWERNLRSALEAFNDQYSSYKKAAEPVVEGTALTRFTLLRAAGWQLEAHVESLIAGKRREIADLGPPEAEIQRVSIRDFRRLGARQRVVIRVKNTGPVTLAANDWKVTCRVTAHPDEHRPRPTDFGCGKPFALKKPVTPNRTQDLRVTLAAPPDTSGDWTLTWQLQHLGKPAGSVRTSFRVEGITDAAIGKPKFNGKLKAGDRIRIKVPITNTGTETLFKNRCELVVRAKRPPGGYRAKRDDFRLSMRMGNDLRKDETIEFSSDIGVPDGVGRWEIRLEFKANRKTVSTKNIRVEVEPS